MAQRDRVNPPQLSLYPIAAPERGSQALDAANS
jgi:hypothetical protein